MPFLDVNGANPYYLQSLFIRVYPCPILWLGPETAL
jgi:hypothetical protein